MHPILPCQTLYTLSNAVIFKRKVEVVLINIGLAVAGLAVSGLAEADEREQNTSEFHERFRCVSQVESRVCFAVMFVRLI